MSIEVNVQNMDSREAAVIEVTCPYREDKYPTAPGVQLKGGEQHRFWLSSGQDIHIVEIQNG